MSGFWLNDYTYQMYDARTHTRKKVVVMALDGGASEPEEVADVVAEYQETFEAECREGPDWQPMDRDQQHGLGPHLNEIKDARHRRQEVGHGRYW